MKGQNRFLVLALALSILIASCGIQAGPAVPMRSDMPTQGLQWVVTYKLSGPANTEKETNVAELRGTNDNSPIVDLQTIFGRLSGSKTQDTLITMPDGKPDRALGMNKVKRFAGLTNYMTLEPATYTIKDAKGNHFCGVKVRLDFNRNLAQYADADQRDFQSLWYYDMPCIVAANGNTQLAIDKAVLRAIVINEVWQLRITAGSYFYNWGHSVTVIPGKVANSFKPRWWEKFDAANSTDDAVSAAAALNDMVNDLSKSEAPWAEFSPAGKFSDSYLIYSAGDADQYATWQRQLLGRQKEYVVFYRPNASTPWDWVTIKPIYNYEWNDVTQNLSNARGWASDPFKGKLDERGLPKDPKDSVISEIERIGWMNGPNASLEQIQYISSSGKILYSMTVRAYVGARDTLVMFGPTLPSLQQAENVKLEEDKQPMPLAYDDKGKPITNPNISQDQWSQYLREGSMWNYIKGDNPFAADLFVQYRFTDNTTWKAVYCGSGDSRYLCGWDPVDWNLDSTYFTQGSTEKPWLVSQLLGEVGVRTLGMSYNSCLYCGTGMLFAMAQLQFRSEYYAGFTQESLWRFDARASQLPDTLAKAWALLHQN